ncbi:MAG: ATP-dependent RNA helicase HrpA [Mycobacteriaceae bacterium]|nr:ATP-dependent RNA helicase HrpA [Mycobacteriaceae bacterium]
MSTHATSPSSARDLAARLGELTLYDEHRLRGRLRAARDPKALARVEADIAAAEIRVRARRESVPAIRYPEALPVSARRDDIAAAIAAHQVVVVAGETGSGKTTQIPKICLELGRGVRGLIGHTQPRRLAARTVAERIAEELGGADDAAVGGIVGYSVRFTDQVSPRTLVKLMTDGILLAEIQRDRLLRRYDTIIIDEAHERSLNIDFLLGYLKQLLPKRPDLKLIITSATIDPGLFARHFGSRAKRSNGAAGPGSEGPDAVDTPAPIVEVSGRSYPVEIRYRPLTVEVGAGDTAALVDRDPLDAVGEAVRELLAAGEGDVLVFLSGEREIRDAADALRDLRLRNTEILPLYARLSAAEQHRVFQPHPGRRVVLATNVAETSLTVPGIRYVVDTGTARVSRYSLRTKVQRLPIEPISQASARQRAGRCGRVADGICVRLYSEADFEARPAFTEPEVLRTNLASVVLQMAALGLGDIENFPFVEPPDRRSIRDGIALLEELGAVAPSTASRASGPELRLTDAGRDMAQLPVDPRMARMLIEAHRGDCLREVLIVVAALSIQDVRERPAEHQQAADARHARFLVDGSDFLAYLKLWDYLREQRKALSGNQFRRMCRDEFLHWMRIREWQDLHAQLRTLTKGLGWTSHSVTDWEARQTSIHQALLAGMLSHIGVREAETREFLGARGAKFAVFPGSGLAKKPPRWVMAAELVETSRLWARMAGRIEPEWAERLAGDLVKRSYSEPHWSAKRGTAVAYERATLYGVPLAAHRPVDFGRIDPPAARELFLRHALVQGEWHTRHEFFRRNRDLLDDVADLENRVRRRDLVVEDEDLFDFYDKRIPAGVVSVRHFDSWWRTARKTDPELLDFTPDTVVNDDAAAPAQGEFPDEWRQGELVFPLTYHFEPGHADDGVTVRIPVAQLARAKAVGFDWLVPGMRAELGAALIKTLPKALRRAVVPAPDFAAAALARLTPRSEPLLVGLARELTKLAATPLSPKDFDIAALPGHLRVTFAAVDSDGKVAGRDKSLAQLKTQLAAVVSSEVARVTAGAERPPAASWSAASLGVLEPTVAQTLAGQTVTGYPALSAEPGGVAVRVFSTPAEQAAAMRTGTRRLLEQALPVQAKSMLAGLSTADRLALSQNPYRSLDALVADCRAAALDELVEAAGGPVRSPEAFDALAAGVRPQLAGRVAELVRLVVPVLAAAHEVRGVLEEVRDRSVADDVRHQLDSLVFDGFVCELGAARLRALPRYLNAAALRLRALPASAARDSQAMHTLDDVYDAYAGLLESLSPARREAPDVTEIFWMIEELRVSLFAQQVGTARPVSAKRVLKAINDAHR